VQTGLNIFYREQWNGTPEFMRFPEIQQAAAKRFDNFLTPGTVEKGNASKQI